MSFFWHLLSRINLNPIRYGIFMKFFLILGNQLFNTKYLKNYKDHSFFMCEDYGLCTYEKHHKLKILLFLSSMRSYYDELKAKKFNVNYYSIKDDFRVSYEKKLEKVS